MFPTTPKYLQDVSSKSFVDQSMDNGTSLKKFQKFTWLVSIIFE